MIPINPTIYWLLWLVLWAVILIFAQRRRAQSGLSLEQLIPVSGFTLVSIFSLIKVLIQVYNFYPELQEKLDWDGMTAVSISCVLGIAIALRELKRLF